MNFIYTIMKATFPILGYFMFGFFGLFTFGVVWWFTEWYMAPPPLTGF